MKTTDPPDMKSQVAMHTEYAIFAILNLEILFFVCFSFPFLQRNSTCFGFSPFFCQGEHPASTAESEKGNVADCREATGGPAGKGRGSCVGIFVCFIYQLECSSILTLHCSVGCFLLLWFILCVCTSVCVCGQCEHVLVCVCVCLCWHVCLYLDV